MRVKVAAFESGAQPVRIWSLVVKFPYSSFHYDNI